MDLYILDASLRRIELFDSYESLIWAERFRSSGDAQISVNATRANRALFQPKTLLALNGSDRVMKIETTTDSENAEGEKSLDIVCSEAVDILKDRVAFSGTPGSEPNSWSLTGTPGTIIRNLFSYVCGPTASVVADRIPFITTGSLYPASTIPEPTDSYVIERPVSDLYSAIAELCEIFDLGFRLYRGPDDSTMRFDVYSGIDRTTNQTLIDPVIFSPNLDSLQNISSLTSIAGYKNIAQVRGLNGTVTVYADDADSTTSGFDRRVLYVDAKDITLAAGPALTAALTQKGMEELAKNRPLSAFDGEISQNSPYRYKEHYFLGDLVEMRNDEGVTSQMRVTEQIFISDAEGERSYPTLSTQLLITPGSWYAWPTAETWGDVPDDASHEWYDF